MRFDDNDDYIAIQPARDFVNRMIELRTNQLRSMYHDNNEIDAIIADDVILDHIETIALMFDEGDLDEREQLQFLWAISKSIDQYCDMS